MTTKAYRKLEDKVKDLLAEQGYFDWEGKRYYIDLIGKPSTGYRNGECKTDVYVHGEADDGSEKELKISVKTEENQEFIENKISPETARALLGENWRDLLIEATEHNRGKFEATDLIYEQGNKITMGWKFEITIKKRTLSYRINHRFSDIEIREKFYKGVDLPPERANASINGVTVDGSGIADLILVVNIPDIESGSDVTDRLRYIDDMEIGDTYFAFTGNSWVTDKREKTGKDDTDGARYLAVYIEWELINDKLYPHFIFGNPLGITGRENKAHLKDLLEKINVSHPDEMIPNRHLDIPGYYKPKKKTR